MANASKRATTMTTKTLCIAIPLALALSVAGAAAQDDGAAAAQARIARDQADLARLQRDLANNEQQAQAIQTADIFGPSDEEKAAAAAAAQREQNQDQGLATLNQRAGDIEESLRKLTGEIEVLNHRLDEIDQRMDRMKKDFDYKLCTMSAQQLGAQGAPGSPGAIPCNPAGPQTGDAAPPVQQVPTGVTRLAPPPGVMGTLTPQEAAAPAAPPPAAAPAPAAAPPMQTASTDTHAQYQAAMDMLARQQYDEASGAFRNFADTYPKDPLTPDALYWLGDVAYVQKDFKSAAHTFAEVLTKYPTSHRSADSMLKLGQAFLAMSQKKEGCTTLYALTAKTPGATRTVLAQAEAVRKSGGCRH
jgi:tol-pal system protein YbgF